MKLAINFSHPASALLVEGRIELDCFKCPDWPHLIDAARQQRPVAVHFDLIASSGQLHTTDWAPIERFLESTGTAYVNLHIAALAKDYPGVPLNTPGPEQAALVFERTLADVQAVTAVFGHERVIAENIMWQPADNLFVRTCVEPDFLRRIYAETGVGLLLDISHARIAAHSLGIPEQEYYTCLPTDRLRELHFAGIHRMDGRLVDHLSILPTDWPALDWVLERIRSGEWASPHMLAFEYGGVGGPFDWRSDPAVIAEQMPQLWKRLKTGSNS